MTSSTQDINDMYADMAACLMAIRNLLIAKNLATHDEFVTVFQERLLTLQPVATHPYLLLTALAHGDMPRELD